MRQVRGQAKKPRKVKSASAECKTGCRHTCKVDQAKTTQLHYTRVHIMRWGEEVAEPTDALRTLTSHLTPCLACLIPGCFPPAQCALQSSSAARTALASSSAGSATSSWTASTGAMKSSAVKVRRRQCWADKYHLLHSSQGCQ